jgi:hypothetical protein
MPAGTAIPARTASDTLAPLIMSRALPQRCAPRTLQGFSTLKDINQYHYDRDDQENVYESSHRVRGDQTKKPEDNQDDRYGPEHFSSPPAVIQRQAFAKNWFLRNYPAAQSMVRSGRIASRACLTSISHRCLLFFSSFNRQADAFSDYLHGTPARQPSESASVRNAGRRLS